MDSPPHRPRRRFGQNFLVDRSVVDWIVDHVGTSADTIEIGPGRAALTTLLAEADRKLVAIEIDRDLAAGLRRRFADRTHVDVVEQDALDVDWNTACQRWSLRPRPVVVGNLPYNVATPILRDLFEAAFAFRRLVVMVQREVADRLTATSGPSYGWLSIHRWLHVSVAARRPVPPAAFRPRPRVHSTVLVLEPRVPPLDASLTRRALDLASAGFTHRRKLLARNLEPLAEAAGVTSALEAISASRTCRAEEVSPEGFLELARRLPGPSSHDG